MEVGRETICVTARDGGVIEVSDEGPGIPESQRERIFEPFYLLHPVPGAQVWA